MSSKAIKHHFYKSLVFFTDFFTVNVHPRKPDERLTLVMDFSNLSCFFLHSRL